MLVVGVSADPDMELPFALDPENSSDHQPRSFFGCIDIEKYTKDQTWMKNAENLAIMILGLGLSMCWILGVKIAYHIEQRREKRIQRLEQNFIEGYSEEGHQLPWLDSSIIQ